jgi:hypothetical protein
MGGDRAEDPAGYVCCSPRLRVKRFRAETGAISYFFAKPRMYATNDATSATLSFDL